MTMHKNIRVFVSDVDDTFFSSELRIPGHIIKNEVVIPVRLPNLDRCRRTLE